jgi:peptidoglycan/LPS O-acetylase OafA/YrhL
VKDKTATSLTSKRFNQLDALRGIAALTVVFDHCMRVIPGAGSGETAHGTALKLAKFTPLHIVWAGHQAVMFFFVLSGFVLSLPFHSGRSDPYGTFVIRRICRIWIPYIVVIAAALCARVLFRSSSGNHYISGWVHSDWAGSLGPVHLLNHLSLIGSFNDAQIDPVVWSLTIEMRISLIFPLLLWVVLRSRWQFSLGGSIALGAVGYAMNYYGALANLGLTIAYIPLFVIGILLAQHRENVKRFYTAWSSRFGLWTILVIALVAYTYPYWALPHVRVLHLAPPDDWATTVGVVLFIVAALGSPAVIAVLSHRVPVWLGRISYSLYLVHAAVLLTVVHLLYGKIPLVGIWLITIATSLVLATLCHRYVEQPGITLGKALARRARARSANSSATSPDLTTGPDSRHSELGRG